jgi:tRNA-specific 2-thiouridylase
MMTAAPAPSTRILVGFTGGPRSSVASVLLKTQGLDVLGVFIDYEGTPWKARCRDDTRMDVQSRADALGIPLIVVPVAPIFEALVADVALHDVLNRRMPQTCLNCHSRILVPALVRIADEQGIPSIATGHRGSLLRGELLRTSQVGDVGDWLAFLPKKLLERINLPLGTFSSQQIEKLAGEIHGTSFESTALERSSCELVTDTWLSWANERTPIEWRAPGSISYRGSISLAEHRGIFQYPVGAAVQVDRRLIQNPNVGASGPLLAVDHEQSSHTVKILFESETARSEVVVERLNWIDIEPATPSPMIEVEVSAAGLHAWKGPPIRGTLFLHLEREGRLILQRPMPRLFRGAPLVFHSGGRVLASGWVAS